MDIMRARRFIFSNWISLHSPELTMSVADEKPFDSANNDDQELLALGYKPSFKREFTNLATVSESLPKYLWGHSLTIFSPRLALLLASWYEIIGRARMDILILQRTLNRECPRALQLHSTLHLSLEALHQWISRINNILIMNMNTPCSIEGRMVLDSWSHDVPHAWCWHCRDRQRISNVWWTVSFPSSSYS
jgi:hypothetical protein